ncbi:FMN-dependent dehydrogenase, includes L-lactate dehydrogenase and type II isopentenyl diphosphate isomerase [Paucidesulfovibrio gracilis DSM 16080]|uniref:FMN-dependent dehydrogenase, includes L-lactate dehydrogenase and type II isopentenyl diphosphate isomerase n=1 Tax=Paucidesulfovibrio gracilis DSM 16080 TaxID=1121449 RepID=A0A1T4XZP4_9BACT|nr:alpha-hydroxy-acid oxidizing protein [Paucidesulfovibrio gracilis]SKA95019.1 FMN-dependent dehydrogenase, includes L-lactate dehydrogenase and type II isopentenyl diphosphate isomerase [Paucidesulfovibrio gracilis DSM 16080]
MKEIRKTAKERFQGTCRVCPVCDGRACSGEVPGMGGLGTGASFRANIEALARYRLNMRLIHDVAQPDTSVQILGEHLDIPVLAAPIGGVSFNMADAMPEEEYIMAKLQGCDDAGIMGCTGDGVPDFIHQGGFDAIRAVSGRGIPFIKPWEDDELFRKIDLAAETGARIMGMDIDAAGLITLRLMGRPVAPKTPKQLKEIIGHTDMKFILKGVMTPDEARLAVDCGADAIVVSNHGGRVLDHTPGVAEVLPAVSSAVQGRAVVLADGGVRSGADILKLLALGADAVMIGRPFSIATVGGGREGVVKYLETLKAQLTQAMVMTGTASAADVERAVIFDTM